MDHSLQAAQWKIAFSPRAYFITQLAYRLHLSGDMRGLGLALTCFVVLAFRGSTPGARIPV